MKLYRQASGREATIQRFHFKYKCYILIIITSHRRQQMRDVTTALKMLTLFKSLLNIFISTKKKNNSFKL